MPFDSPAAPRGDPSPRGDPYASPNEILLYGPRLLDVRFLRQRGWGVHREGRLFRVGNRLMTPEGLTKVADRERSLLRRD